ncbi:M1 family metallopeptidase [Streptomyces sp. NBC_00841]|uniref:M1 family metallopeptidase n=1 Tax=unclassified Streptomyces TaxID=2593676 RepID=UPI002250754A|nr:MULTISPECIES: M1 family metallopeptidase [unclassified Streptomyces]MCX4530066.1 M1 family metallopeptidase [Streptomyces sp. NBC_01669]WSA04142.1 M1 family metallopeptidase [Streptomyces sp. NBC_00841]
MAERNRSTLRPSSGAATSADSYLSGHGNGGYRTTHYDLELRYRPDSGRLSGRAVLAAVAEQALTDFTLDLGAFRLDRVKVDGIRAARYTHRAGKLRIWPARALRAGRPFTVEVHYVGNPRPIRSHWGDLGWEELDDGALVAGQPIGAPSWFPCNDHPADKATYRISVTAPSPYTVLANGNLHSRTTHSSTTTWVYEQPTPMASYLATALIGHFETVELAPAPIPQTAAVPARLLTRFRWDFARHSQMMTTFEHFFGPYPFDRYAVVVVDEDLEVPVEAQGLSIFGANHVDGHRSFERLVAHELAHQWFGNSLTLAAWRHIWLNEGFACYSEWLWSESSGGRRAADLATQAHASLAEHPRDLRVADPGVRQMFDDRIYLRGALALHALRTTLGSTAFFAMLQEWTATYRHRTVTTEAFIATAQRHTLKPLDELFTTWLHDTQLPELPHSANWQG